MDDGFQLEERDGILLARCEALLAVPGIAHAFSTRRDSGGLDFDLGGADDPASAILSRRARFLAAAGLGASEPAILRQVHGARVVPSSACAAPPEADAADWVRGDPGRLVPSVRTADCVPVLLVDANGRGVAAVHAGWRGVAAGVVPAAVASLARRGIEPAGLLAAVGPAIGACCYAVGADVAARVVAAAGGRADLASGGPERVLLDLKGAVREQLARSGIARESIRMAPWCTRCRGDLFFSYRRDGAAAGRMMASAGPAS